MADRAARIRAALDQALRPSTLSLLDESAHHAGHAGAAGGGGHFAVRIVAECFLGKPLLERHRMIYQALGTLMQNDIHALRIDARSPDEDGPGTAC